MAAQDDASQIQDHRNPITLTRFILAEQRRFKSATGELSMLLQSIQLACKAISNACSKAGIANLYGLAGDTNSSGDTQKKLDVFANDCFVNSLNFSNVVFAMASEENKDAMFVNVDNKEAHYAVVFDPLDGSSNIDANVSVGTIFGVYRRASDDSKPPTEADLLRPGRDLVAAGYAVYGSATMLVLTTGHGLHGFTLDPSLGEFILTHKDMRIPSAGKIYSINEGNSASWDDATRLYIESCKAPKTGSAKSLRYIGSMVADVHRTILYGGIFCYPGDKKNKKGKLRLLYEVNPMSMLIEQAGGKSTTGTANPLDLPITEIHERCPVFMGSARDVEEVEALYKLHPSH